MSLISLARLSGLIVHLDIPLVEQVAIRKVGKSGTEDSSCLICFDDSSAINTRMIWKWVGPFLSHYLFLWYTFIIFFVIYLVYNGLKISIIWCKMFQESNQDSPVMFVTNTVYFHFYDSWQRWRDILIQVIIFIIFILCRN